MLDEHSRLTYDVVYQFSNIERFVSRRVLRRLPALVIQPETHMAGELKSFLAEDDLIRKCETWLRRRAVRLVLKVRAKKQKRDIRLAAGVICISNVFRNHLINDYDISPTATKVVPNPIDTDVFFPRPKTHQDNPITILFVGRISTRKGIDLLVPLTHRLDDLNGKVRITIIGGPTLWSDYRPLLADLNPRIGTYVGAVEASAVASYLREADLLVQPSKYEPFGLTVAEALAVGIPVVTTDEVGASENVSSECSTRVASDINQLEAAVREMIARPRSQQREQSAIARSEAERLYARDHVAKLLEEALYELSHACDWRIKR